MRALCVASLVLLFHLTSVLIAVPTASAQNQCGTDFTFNEQNRIVVGEVEEEPARGAWEARTNINDYTGSSFYYWAGDDAFRNPGRGTLTYKFRINNPGRYRFILRGYIGRGNSGSDHNDAFVRFPDADEFYAQQGDSIVYPRGNGRNPDGSDQTPYPSEGDTEDGWFKAYMNNLNDWNWRTATYDNNAHFIYVEFDTAGVYTLEISGRSNGYAIDRWALFDESIYDQDNIESTALEETRCSDNAPKYAESDPVDGRTNYPRGRNLTVSFTEPVRVSGQWFTITCPPTFASIQPADSTVTPNDNNRHVEFTIDPDDTLPQGYDCTFTINRNRVKDSNDQSLAGDNTFTFNVDGNPQPFVQTINPADGATGVAPTANIALTFSENMAINNGDPWFTINCTPSGTQVNRNRATTTGSGNARTINPDDPLTVGDTCTLDLNTSRVRDNQDQRLYGQEIFTFTVGDPIPQLISVTPSSGARNVYPNTDLTLTFDDEVFRGSGRIRILQNGAVVESLGVNSDPDRVRINGATVTIDPVSLLIYGTDYAITIDDGTFVNGNGNPVPGLTE